MTYKKASATTVKIFRDRGLVLTNHAQRQFGYIGLYLTEGEISSRLDHTLKMLLRDQLADRVPAGGVGDNDLLERLEAYAELVSGENPEGGEISMGWLLQECAGEEIWDILCPQEGSLPGAAKA